MNWTAANMRRKVQEAPAPNTLSYVLREIRNAALLGQESMLIPELQQDWIPTLQALGYSVTDKVISWSVANQCEKCFWNTYTEVPCGRRCGTTQCDKYYRSLDGIAILCNAFGTHLDKIYKEWMNQIQRGDWNA